MVGGFAPEVIDGDYRVDVVEAPHPVVGSVLGDADFGFPESFCRWTGIDGIGVVGFDEGHDPSCAGVAGGPGCPGAVSAFGGELEVAAVGHAVVVVVEVQHPGGADLAEVAGADGLFGSGFGLGEDGEEDGGEDRDDGDYDQEFDEGEGAAGHGEFQASDNCRTVVIRWSFFRRGRLGNVAGIPEQ